MNYKNFTETSPETLSSSEDIFIFDSGGWCYRGELSYNDHLETKQVLFNGTPEWYDFEELSWQSWT